MLIYVHFSDSIRQIATCRILAVQTECWYFFLFSAWHLYFAQSAGAVEYTDCTSAEG